jgi:hypothetical protein
MATHDQMAAAFDAALTGGDPDGFVALLAPGAIVWHNHDRKEVDARENMAAIGMLGQLGDNLKNERVLSAPPTPASCCSSWCAARCARAATTSRCRTASW